MTLTTRDWWLGIAGIAIVVPPRANLFTGARRTARGAPSLAGTLADEVTHLGRRFSSFRNSEIADIHVL
jgi:hypothetical protein